MGSVVLIAGVSRYLGRRLAAALSADPGVDRIIGVDTRPPPTAELPLLGRTEFVRADIRNPLIARVITQARVTTVVHAALLGSPRAAGGRGVMHEMNVIGTMQLLAACQKSDELERVVLRSSTAVYGCSASDPAVFTEDMHPNKGGSTGHAKDAVEVEGYLRGFARRRPDVTVSILRLAGIVGPTADLPLTRYLQRGLVPARIGFDPRLQLLHESDAVETLRLAATSYRPGTVNVAGTGVLPLSQALRRLGRTRLPLPAAVLGIAGRALQNDTYRELTSEETAYLSFGRAVDVTALHDRFGYRPRYTTAQALDSIGSVQAGWPHPALAGLGLGSRLLQDRHDRRVAVSSR